MFAYILYTALTGLAILPLLLYWRNPYFFNDLSYAISAIQIGVRMTRFKKQKPFYSILDCFLDKVARQPHKKFIVFEESSFTYSQADKESNRVARALSTHAPLKEGDTVALFLGNEPHFVWVWLAMAKLGCIASLLNCNIRSKSLLHCFSCCDAKVLVAGAGKLGKWDWERLLSSVWFMKWISGFLHYSFYLVLHEKYKVTVVFHTSLTKSSIFSHQPAFKFQIPVHQHLFTSQESCAWMKLCSSLINDQWICILLWICIWSITWPGFF